MDSSSSSSTKTTIDDEKMKRIHNTTMIMEDEETHRDQLEKQINLSIIIKLPNHEQQQQQCACTVCGKSFSSRKAWGGHIKVHMNKEHNTSTTVARQRRRRYKKNKISLPKGPEEEEEAALICSVCNREFKSSKSLFGHMRSHPDRPWRGIRPPQIDSNAEEDISKHLTVGWLCKDKRGRDSKQQIPEAASCLIELANSSPSFKIGDISDSYETVVSVHNNINIKRKMTMEEPEPEAEEHHCNMCEKSFSSGQALGGHKTLHRKPHQGGGDEARRKILAFDLNQLPTDVDA